MSNYVVPISHWSVCLFLNRASLTTGDAARRLAVFSFSWSSGGRISSYSPLMVLARRRVRSVGSLSGLDSKASISLWLI